MRILIVEDEPKTAAYVSKGLSEHAYVTDICLLYTSDAADE